VGGIEVPERVELEQVQARVLVPVPVQFVYWGQLLAGLAVLVEFVGVVVLVLWVRLVLWLPPGLLRGLES
jgi:hypothetical protein